MRFLKEEFNAVQIVKIIGGIYIAIILTLTYLK
jgi:hypothetical protein